jgi:hypothetical protein
MPWQVKGLPLIKFGGGAEPVPTGAKNKIFFAYLLIFVPCFFPLHLQI